MPDAGNIFLILLRLDLSKEATLCLATQAKEDGGFRPLERGGGHRLLVGILDSQMKSTSTPMEVINFAQEEVDAYNTVLECLERLNAMYQDEDGFVRHPERFDRSAQEAVRKAIAHIGCLIYEIFPDRETAGLREWLGGILTGRGLPEDHHVTIITNDFDIPWYWLKNRHSLAAPMLCEAVSLGTMQLKTQDRRRESTPPEPEGAGQEHFRALLINGSPDLPLASESLHAVHKALKDSMRGRAAEVTVDVIDSREKLRNIDALYREQEKIVREFKIVHFSGHYSGTRLVINGESVFDRVLQPFLKDSLVVLDGCSSSSGLKAWVDPGGIASSLINRGQALACVVTSLPVKDDPLVGRVLWRDFYQEIRRGRISIGQALVKARRTLRTHLDTAGLPNLIPALYQLCGNSSVTLDLEEREVVR